MMGYGLRLERLRLAMRQIMGDGSKRGLYLYGAGARGKASLRNLKCIGLDENVLGYIDDAHKYSGGGQKVYGKPVLSTKELAEAGDDGCILLTNYATRSCIENLARQCIDLRRVFFVNELLLDDDSSYPFEEHLAEFEQVYGLWTDGLSQWIYKSTVEARLSGQLGFLSRTSEEPQYFSFFQEHGLLGNQEIFVDAGAYTGDTVAAFMRATGDRFAYVYAFEPDSDNCALLQTQGFGDHVLVYQHGLYDFDGKVSFDSGAGSQSKVMLGQEMVITDSVSVRRLDGIALPDRHITILKMDIEGSELKALQGARQMIRENHPKLAICIYHKIEDLWEIPLYIKELSPDYKLYLRNHTDGLDEMVLYAV